MSDLVDKYLGNSKEMDEAMGRGMTRMLQFSDPMQFKAAKKALTKAKITHRIAPGGQNKIMIGDDDMDNAEEVLVRAGAYPM